MKKNRIFVIALAALMILGGCAKEEFEAPVSVKKEAGAVDYSAQSFNASIATADETRTYIGEDKKIYWTKDDRVSVFCSSTDNLQYTFTGETGSRTGILHKIVSDALAGTELDKNYAFYPYDASNSISGEGVMTVSVPATQTYSEDTFGAGANIMAAVTTGTGDYDLQFKNAGGYLVVQLYGDATVRKIVLSSTAGEKLSGKADIAFDNTGAPVLTMHNDASSSITLDCGDGVKLGKSADKATEFWFVLPPVTFSQGFSLQVVCDEGSFAKQKNTAGTIHRNGIVTVSPFSVSTRAGQYVGLMRAEETWTIDKVLEYAASSYDKISGYVGIIKLFVMLSSSKIETGDISLSRIIYTTTDPNGNIIEASGLVAFPMYIINQSTSYDKIVSVQHGTCGIDESPSLDDVPKEILPVLKKGNDVVVLADYLGYGISRTGDLQHPYIHNKLTGSTCADLIEAAQEYVESKGLTRASDYVIELMGYSQGGAASISTLYELESRSELAKHIGNVYAGGGPYDLKVFLDKFLEDKVYDKAAFLAYLIRGIVYGEGLDVDFHNLFAPEVFQGANSAFMKFSTVPNVGSWNSSLGSDLTKVLHPDFFVDGYNGNEDIIEFLDALFKNSCTRSVPVNKDKIKLYHSPNDKTVLYGCTEAAAETWSIKSENVIDLEMDNHADAGIEFFAKYINEDFWDIIKKFL